MPVHLETITMYKKNHLQWLIHIVVWKEDKKSSGLNKKCFRNIPVYIISVKVLFLCENVNNFHQVCSRSKQIGTLNKCSWVGKPKGHDRYVEAPLRLSLCTKTLKTAAKDMKVHCIVKLCIMIPLDEKYIIQNNYELKFVFARKNVCLPRPTNCSHR